MIDAVKLVVGGVVGAAAIVAYAWAGLLRDVARKLGEEMP